VGDTRVHDRELPRNTDIAFIQISPDYFRTIKVPLSKGRFFTDDDSQNSEPVVILNQAAADFKGEEVIGKNRAPRRQSQSPTP
jgi:hypothetical protein